jgi:hypothetical protein
MFECVDLSPHPDEVFATVQLWKGVELPTDIDAFAVDAWPDEELAWSQTVVLATSAVDSSGIDVQFNLVLVDPFVLDASYSYVRVEFVLGEDATLMPSMCDEAGALRPSAIGIHDGDGVAVDGRSFIFDALSTRWHWNEDVLVSGDWLVRLELTD